MPSNAEPGMAFVLVQHLDPNHKSLLTEIIRRYTTMKVYEVEDGITINKNCAYIIPPGFDMALKKGCLYLYKPSKPHGQRLPIDFFFRSLAQEQNKNAIGIIFSGTGSDGTLGVRAIKEEGGMVMVQTPESTEFEGMPRSVIETGLADYQLQPAKMVKALIAFFSKENKIVQDEVSFHSEKDLNTLKKIFILIGNQTGHDFTSYKPNTTRRRIERRMSVHKINSLDEYLRYLQQSKAEVDLLFNDMLIGVTNFFRDKEAFKALKDIVIPKIFLGKKSGETVRIWCAGCSTGEEAYSIAFLLQEYMETVMESYNIQVFATDIDPKAIESARKGIYSTSITENISQDRIDRFFKPITEGKDGNFKSFQIKKNIRDMLIFSEQNIIKDPPFSKLDLISCRNLMIYMSGELQKRLIPLFHYSLNPEGYLFLGTSETVSEYANLFHPVDRKSKIFLRKEGFQSARNILIGDYFPSSHRMINNAVEEKGKKSFGKILSPKEITERTLLKQLAPSSALVNAQGDIFYLHGRTGKYLEPVIGEVGSYNIIKMAREGLRNEITTSLSKAVQKNEIIRTPNLNIKTNGNFTRINLIICPAGMDNKDPQPNKLYLVILEDIESSKPILSFEDESISKGEKEEENNPYNSLLESLRIELRAKEEYLQTATEELETANEELKSSNEEMQSVNEELQSTNEELETSKEELQSVNEELTTVNNELSIKVSDLSRTNNDMNNLLAGTGIATIFVDHQMRIMRYTPTAQELINLIPGDLGRPINHILSNLLDYNSLAQDIQSVFDRLIPKAIEVKTFNGRYYRMNIIPYRTIENVIEGAVITFVDITDLQKLQLSLQKSEDLLKVSQKLSKVGGWEWDLISQEMYWTDELYAIHEYSKHDKILSAEDFLNRSINCYNEEDRPIIRSALQRCIDESQPYDLDFPFTPETGRNIWIRTTAHPEIKNGKVIRIVGNMMDITERKHAEQEILRQLSEKEILLKEVHHRIKNNITSIEALLSLQIQSTDNKAIKDALQDAITRVQSMRLLYDKLLINKDYQEVSIKNYIESLIDAIAAVFMDGRTVTISKNIQDFSLNSKVIFPIGIIINELMTNIFKYAFQSNENNLIEIDLNKEDNKVILTIHDNGVGIDKNLLENKSTGFGLSIVAMLSKQLKGTYSIKNDKGTKSVLEFQIST